MANIGDKQLGEFLRKKTQNAVEKDRDVQATVTHITNWSTTGELKCTLLNGDVIWVNASGNLQDISVSDVIWVRKFGVGQRSQYRMVGYFKQSGGTYAPSAIRSDVLAASKVSELWASDGTPQAVDVDAAGLITLMQKAIVDGDFAMAERAAAGADVAAYGQVWVKTATPNQLWFTDDAGTDFPVSGTGIATLFKSYTVSTQGLGAGVTLYAGGFYESSAADANLTQASTTVTFGSANISYAAHAFLVAAAAGTATGGAGAVTIVVSGISITDEGTRTPGDSETIVADITAMATDQYFETAKKWLGQITYTLTVGGTGHTAYAADFNYGLAKYDDFGNRDFTITDFEAVGYAGANETNLEVALCHHAAAGWTYSAAAFVPGPAAIVALSTDHPTDDQLASGEHFAFKRVGLSTAVSGSTTEGLLVRVVTTANNAIEYMNVHVGVLLT